MLIKSKFYSIAIFKQTGSEQISELNYCLKYVSIIFMLT